MRSPVSYQLVPWRISLLNEGEHNYIVACFHEKKSWGLACADHTTGEFSVADYGSFEALSEEVGRIHPRELLVSDEQKELFSGLPVTQYYDGYTFMPGLARPYLETHFRVHSLEGFGCAHYLRLWAPQRLFCITCAIRCAAAQSISAVFL